jgi:hypothetical protein
LLGFVVLYNSSLVYVSLCTLAPFSVLTGVFRLYAVPE